MALLKIGVVHGDRIVVRFASYDQSWYIQAAYYLIHFDWLGPYNEFTLVRQPGYPIWIAFIYFTKIPLRLATELLFINGAFCFSVSLMKAKIPSWLGVVIFGSIIFHPLSFLINQESLSESFYTPLLLFGLSGMVMAFLSTERSHLIFFSFVIGISFGLLWNTRHENILIIGYLIIFFVLYFYFKAKNETHQNLRPHPMILILIPLLCIAIFTLSIRWMNDSKYGLFATSEMIAPGFTSACKAFTRIPPEHDRRWVPVPRDVREKAYQVSPHFKALRPYLEEVFPRVWFQFGCQHDKVCDDYEGGWFPFAFRSIVFALNQSPSAPAINNYFQSIADEINKACEKKAMPCRSPRLLNTSCFSNADPSTYLSQIPSSFAWVFRLQFIPFSITDKLYPIREETPALNALFSQVTHQSGEENALNDAMNKELFPRLINGFKKAIGQGYGKCIKFLSWAAFFLFLVQVIRSKFNKFQGEIFFILLLIGFTLFLRLVLLAFLDATAYTINDFRFIYPVSVLYPTFLILLIFLCAKKSAPPS